MMIRPKHFALTAAALLAVSGSAAPARAGYHLVNSAVVGGEGGWDDLTVDPVARRVYLSRSSHVMVLDADSLKVVGDIPHTPGVHGIALAPGLGRGYTSNGADTTVTVFDMATLKELSRVRVGIRPDAILFDPATKRVFTFNAGSQDATAIDAEKNEVVGTVPLGGKPEFARTDGKGHMFINIEDKNEVIMFDTRSLKVLAHWGLVMGEGPSGLAFDEADGILFAVCGNEKMIMLDSETGILRGSLPIGKNPDGAGWDAALGQAFSSNGEGTLTVIQRQKDGTFKVAETVPTKRGARTMTVDPKTHRVFVVTAQFGTAPEPTADKPHPRAPMLPGTFEVLVYGE